MSRKRALTAQALSFTACGTLLLASALRADSLSGTVRDPAGRAVDSAEIRVHEFDGSQVLRSRSADTGRYLVPTLSPGSYWVEAESPQSLLFAAARIQIDGDTNHDIDLSLRPVETAITVLGNAMPTDVNQSGKRVSTVTGRDYRKRLKFTIADGLRGLPGVRVQQLRTPGSLTAIQVRGLRNRDTAILIDGLRFRDAGSIAGDASAFLSDLIYVNTERVELLRGSSSSLYGSHAIGGAIDVRSSHGGGPIHGEMSSDGGGLGTLRGLARFGGGLPLTQRLVYSGGLSHWNVSRGLDGFDPFRNTSGQGFIRFSIRPAVTISGRLYVGDSFLAINEAPSIVDAVLANHSATGAVPAVALRPEQLDALSEGRAFSVGPATFVPDFNDPDSRRVSSFNSSAITLRHEISPDRSYRATYQIVDTTRSYRDGPGGTGSYEPVFSSSSRFAGRVETMQLRADLAANPHQTLTIGYEYEREEYADFNSNGSPEPAILSVTETTLRQSNHALFAQDQLRWKRLQVAFSGRLQSFRVATPAFTGGTNPYRESRPRPLANAYTGDVAVAYFLPSRQTKLRAHARTGYRAPSSYERFGASFFQGFPSFWGAPSLLSERSASYEAGLDQWFTGGKGRLSATMYYIGLEDVVTFDFGVIDSATDPWGRFGGFRNSDGAVSRGMEVDVSATPTPYTTVRAAYTFVNSDSQTPTVPGTGFYKMLGVSDHMFALTAVQTVGKRLDVILDISAVSSYPLRLYRVPGWLVFPGPVKVDAAFSYRIPLEGAQGIDVYAKIENFINRQYYEDGYAAPRIWGLLGLRFRF